MCQTLEYEDDKVEGLYIIIEGILEEDGQGETNAINHWNSVVGNKS